MKFSNLENIMESNGIKTLAEIARTLDTTPQAVSNWKARDQVPYHVAAKINSPESNLSQSANISLVEQKYKSSFPINDNEGVLSLSDILLVIAEQLKVIFIFVFSTVFITFTYVKFIQPPLYQSTSTILLPSNQSNLNGLVGLASQFGVDIPQGSEADLSSPTLFPELINSRTFVKIILGKEFYKQQYGKKLSLLAILTHGDNDPMFGLDTLVHQAMEKFQNMVEFSSKGSFSVLTVEADDPILARELNKVVIDELQKLNQYFRSQKVRDKTIFIENRIASVKYELEVSKIELKEFNEKNRQVTSPALQLGLDRLTRGVEIQKGIFLTLKQQLELAKIEEVQGTSIVRVLDTPDTPFGASNKNIKLSFLLSIIVGVGLGLIFAFLRSYINNKDIDERKKIRRMKNFIKKKSKGVIFDRRISGVVSLLLIGGLPFYLGHKSQIPMFFGMYSLKMMVMIVFYIGILICTSTLFIYNKIEKLR